VETSTYTPTEAQLEQLVTPIALYPDALVAQILIASQYTTQIVEATRFVQQNPGMTPDQLVKAAAGQDWNPSIQALLPFSSVLNNMNQNLSWTSALGEAYYNDSQGVMHAVQVMRDRAYQAGSLKTTSQQTVTVQNGTGGGQTIIIQPANPQVVYVPTYNPTTVYGAPAEVYPGYSSTDMLASALLGFGTGIAVGALAFGGGGGGWNSWGCNWGGGNIYYNNSVYVAHNNVWGPNRWGPYNPYHPYNPYNPYHPYHPYGPYNPYNPYHPNSPYSPYNNRLYGNNAYNHNYNAYNHNANAYNHNYNAYNHNANYNRNANLNYNKTNNFNNYHPTTSQGWNKSGLNNYRGYDQHASNGFESGAFNGFGHNGDARMASDRGFSSLGGHGGYSGYHGGGGGGGFKGYSGGGGRGGHR
jgi:Protein of unknown function (DUF3300)